MNDVRTDMHCRDLLELDIQSHQVWFQQLTQSRDECSTSVLPLTIPTHPSALVEVPKPGEYSVPVLG